MREGWERKVLKEATIFKSGKTISKDIEKLSGEILYTKVGDMNLEGNELNIITSSRFVNQEDIVDNQIIPIGSVIFPKRGGAIATNKKRRIVKPTIVDLNTMAISPSKELLSDFLYYFIESIDLSELSNGANVPQINNGSFDRVYIQYPKSLPEQKAIVKILDEAFAKIDQAKANIERNIENAKELFQSKLNEIFSHPSTGSGQDRGEGDAESLPNGWEEKKLNDIAKNLDRDRVPITKNKRISGDIPYYGASGIVDYVKDFLFEDDLLLVSEDGANLLARTYPIAFSVSGKTWVNNHAHVLKFEEITTQHYVELYLNSIKLDDYISGMAQPKLNQKKLNSIPIPIPQLITQKEIVELALKFKDAVNSVVTILNCKLINLDELKKSLLQKAFAGELV